MGNQGSVIATAAAEHEGPEPDVSVDRALSVPTRAGIYRRLRTEGTPLTAREVAEMFGLHPNVARGHLDTLSDAGLVVTGRRKHPGGGRPAKVYVAREQSDGGRRRTVPAGSELAVGVLVQALDGQDGAADVLERLAREQGRKLVTAAAGRADERDFEAAAVVAVEALRAAFPEVRLAAGAGDSVRVEGLEVGLRLVGEASAALGDAVARGLLDGALRAAGAPARVDSVDGRVTAVPDREGVGGLPEVTSSVDARSQSYQAGVVMTMRAMVALDPGDYLQVLTDTQGAPAAFARWADRAGHQVVDVARIRDLKGQEAVRLLLRKALS